MTSLFDVTDNDDILALQPRLTDEDAGVRRIALIELADLEEPDGLLWLVDRLAQDPAEEVRAEAARLLEAWEDEPVVEALCQALTDPSPAVQSAAAQSLSLLKSEAAGRVILPWTGHADISVRIAAFRALRELRFPDAAPAALRRWTITTPTCAAKRSACWAGSSSSMPCRPWHDWPVMTRTLKSAAPPPGRLGLASDAQVLPALRQALQDQRLASARRSRHHPGQGRPRRRRPGPGRSLERRLLASAPARHPQPRPLALCPGPGCA